MVVGDGTADSHRVSWGRLSCDGSQGLTVIGSLLRPAVIASERLVP